MKNIERIFILFWGDIVILFSSFWLTLIVGFWGDFNQEIIESHSVPFFFLHIGWVIILFLFNLYELKLSKPNISNLKNIGQALVSCFLLGIVFFYLTPFFEITPKINLVINTVTFGGLFFLWRRMFYLLFAKNFRKKAILITSESNQVKINFINFLENNPHTGIEIVNSYTDAEVFLSQEYSNIDILIVSGNVLKNPQIFKAIFKRNIEILEFTQAYENLLAKIPIDTIDESWLIHKIPEENILYKTIKRCVDIFISSLALIIFSPFLILAIISIKLQDRGPIFIKQTRTGKHNIPFKLLKLRSMVSLHSDGSAESGGVPTWAEKNDPRITSVGNILRKTHIDELPQLINVLRGDISLVGPRPERPEFVAKLEQEIPFYHMRHIIKPGFTGWAQIKFRYARNVLDSKEKFEYDLYYIKNRNIILDFGIITKTIQIIFTHQ